MRVLELKIVSHAAGPTLLLPQTHGSTGGWGDRSQIRIQDDPDPMGSKLTLGWVG